VAEQRLILSGGTIKKILFVFFGREKSFLQLTTARAMKNSFQNQLCISRLGE